MVIGSRQFVGVHLGEGEGFLRAGHKSSLQALTYVKIVEDTFALIQITPMFHLYEAVQLVQHP